MSWSDGDKSKKKKKKSSSALNSSLRESFVCEYNCWVSDSRPGSGPCSNFHPQEDCSEIFLSHARLYVFAEKSYIQLLKKLPRQKLQHTLAIYSLYPDRVQDITALLKYVYANTVETVDGVEDIRTMLAHYVGTEMATLIRYGDTKDLMLDNGEILGDFLKMFAKH